MRWIVVFTVFCAQVANAANVGLLINATGRYIDFVEPLINSAEKHFCKEHCVTYYVFTDGPEIDLPNTVTVYQKRLGWPYDTMMRYHIYYNNRALFEEQDYLFACDADMRFVDAVGSEILSERTATIHPGFVGKRGSYDQNPASHARVQKGEGEFYFAGGFYGGSTEEFLNICQTNRDYIDDDLSRGVIAVWHDESHWNRYCIDHKPTCILSPAYCYPESLSLPYPKKLLALDKDHHEYRK